MRRFIPAWAGNRIRICISVCARAVHPRVGGEQVEYRIEGGKIDGSSPRGRGTDRAGHFQPNMTRFIPAWAGNRDHRNFLQ